MDDYNGLSSGTKIAIGLIFGLFVPLGFVLFCCWYRRKIQSLSAGRPSTHRGGAAAATSPRRKHARLDEDEHRTHTLELDDPPMEFSVQAFGTDDSRGGSKASRTGTGRGYGEDGLEEIKLDGDEDDTEEEERRDKPKKKKKKGAKKSGKAKKKKAVEEDEDVDELELGGI